MTTILAILIAAMGWAATGFAGWFWRDGDDHGAVMAAIGGAALIGAALWMM